MATESMTTCLNRSTVMQDHSLDVHAAALGLTASSRALARKAPSVLTSNSNFLPSLTALSSKSTASV